MKTPALTVKALPSPLVLRLISRAVLLDCFPWPEAPWTKALREMQEKGLTPTGREGNDTPQVQALPS